MSERMFLRVTGVRNAPTGECFVTYYSGDVEAETLWLDVPPSAGDLVEVENTDPVHHARRLASPVPGSYTPQSDAVRWRKSDPLSGVSRLEVLRQRHTIRQAVRSYLDGRGYIEIDAPLLVHGTTPDIAVDSFQLGDRYLATSTEYQMKRLAVGGFERIYSLTQNFRNDMAGPFRNPEFTMLEWGRVGEDMGMIEEDIECMTQSAMRMLGLPDVITYQGRPINMRTPWQRMSVSDAVQSITGVSIADYDLISVRRAAEAAGITIKPEWQGDRDFIFSLLMDQIQPQLGADAPLFLCDWPMFQTTSARQQEDRFLADRSELFIAGIEIADGFAGVADYAMQYGYFEMMQNLRKASGTPAIELDTRYLDALKVGGPYGSGMAMGFDRLVMLLTNQQHIKNVLAFAWDEV